MFFKINKSRVQHLFFSATLLVSTLLQSMVLDDIVGPATPGQRCLSKVSTPQATNSLYPQLSHEDIEFLTKNLTCTLPLPPQENSDSTLHRILDIKGSRLHCEYKKEEVVSTINPEYGDSFAIETTYSTYEHDYRAEKNMINTKEFPPCIFTDGTRSRDGKALIFIHKNKRKEPLFISIAPTQTFINNISTSEAHCLMRIYNQINTDPTLLDKPIEQSTLQKLTLKSLPYFARLGFEQSLQKRTKLLSALSHKKVIPIPKLLRYKKIETGITKPEKTYTIIQAIAQQSKPIST